MVMLVTPPVIFLVYAAHAASGTPASRMARRKLMLLKEQRIKRFGSLALSISFEHFERGVLSFT